MERKDSLMRKLTFSLLLVLCVLLCGFAAAETLVFDPIKATVDMTDAYVVLTPQNLSTYEEWLTAHDKSLESTQQDFEQRGVLMQGWNSDGDACLELTALETEQSTAWFDIDQQPESVRRAYRLSHFPNNDFADAGYDYTVSEWKKVSAGRFLILRYTKRTDGVVEHRGFARRTIRNGYEITLDMKIYGRSATNKDNAALNEAWDTFVFTEILPLSLTASAKLNITTAPPTETSENSFDIEGTAAPDVELTAVVMGLSAPDPVLFSVVVPKNGKFKLPIKLSREGVFLITLTASVGEADAAEMAYPVTYQRTLLAVNVTTEVPQLVTSDELRIAGTSVPGASIQCIVNETTQKKKVAANSKWYVDIDTSAEGTYDVVIVFSKKGLADRRFTYSFTRKWSEEDMLKQLAKEAIKPSYKLLCNKIDGYDGRVMGYKAYVVTVSQAGEDWIVQLALTKKNGKYSDIIIVTCSEEPSIKPDQRVMMYGKCAGMSVSSDDGEGGSSFPCFELLVFDELE